MSDLVERVREALYYANPIKVFDNDGSTIGHLLWFEARDVPFWAPTEEEARAAIAEVRRFDVERGPSDAEIEKAVVGSWERDGAYRADTKTRQLLLRDMTTALKAAAKVRQEEAE